MLKTYLKILTYTNNNKCKFYRSVNKYMDVRVNNIPGLKFYNPHDFLTDQDTQYKNKLSSLLRFYKLDVENSNDIPEQDIPYEIELEYVRNVRLRNVVQKEFPLISEKINSQIGKRIRENAIPYFYQIEYMRNEDCRKFLEKKYPEIANQFVLKNDRRSELYNFFYELFMSNFRRNEAMVGIITERQAMFTIIERIVDEHHPWFMNSLHSMSKTYSHINEHIGFIVYSFMNRVEKESIGIDNPTDGISYSQSFFLFDILDSYKKAKKDLKNIDSERYEDMKSYFEKYMIKIRTELDKDCDNGFQARLPVREEKVIGAVHTEKEMDLVKVYSFLRSGNYLTAEEMQTLCNQKQFRDNNGERDFEGYYTFFMNDAYKKAQEAKRRIEQKKVKIELDIAIKSKIKSKGQDPKKSLNLIPNEEELKKISKKQLDKDVKKMQEDRAKIQEELDEIQNVLKSIQETGVIEIEELHPEGIPAK